MQPELYNGFWTATDSRIGSYSAMEETPTQAQLENANNIRSFFLAQGWTLQAICGMLGNMQGESTINPGFIQATNRDRLPNNAAALRDVPNSVMVNFYREYYNDPRKAYAIGLVQWDGQNNSGQQKLVGYATRNNFAWYDGWGQCYRIQGEYQQDAQYHFFKSVRINGTQYTFANYITSTASPEELAKAWSTGYERNDGGVGFRGTNALWWYNYFEAAQPPLVEIGYPLTVDPDEPPFDPVNPAPVEPDAEEGLPIWMWFAFKKKKEMRRVWRRI